MALKHLFLGIILSCLIFECLGQDRTCPENCTCSDAKVTCNGVSKIPVTTGRENIRELVINNHSITSIEAGDFANFTQLSQLLVNGGLIKKLTDQSFREIRDSVTHIDLQHNGIEVLENTFVNFTKLENLVLDFNALTKLETGTFVGMPSLNTLRVEHNMIVEVETGALKDLPSLDNVNFYTNKLKAIPWDGLRGLNSLKTIDVRKNEISGFGETTDVYLEKLEEFVIADNPLHDLGSFPNVSKSLKILNMEFTQIASISIQTWRNIPQLDRLMLSGSVFPELTQGMFRGLDGLKELDLTDMPNLLIVGPHAFDGLNNIVTIDLSRNRKLSTIDQDAFRDTKVSKVLISNCAMETFPENLLPWASMVTMQIAPNPINCDCHAQWMANVSVFGHSSDVRQLKCHLPETLFNKTVVSLNPGLFICTSKMDHKSRFTTAVAVAICVAVFMTTFALLFKFRHRISMSCRRYFQYRRYRNDMIFTVEHDTSVGELEEPEARPLKNLRLETVPLDEELNR